MSNNKTQAAVVSKSQKGAKHITAGGCVSVAPNECPQKTEDSVSAEPENSMEYVWFSTVNVMRET